MKIFRRNQGTLIKILSLSIGLTVGLVLIAKVQLERNYNRCIVGKERVFMVNENLTDKEKKEKEYENTSGGVVPALCQYIPEIEVGTRYTENYRNEKLTFQDGNRYAFENTVFADSCFFDIFGTKILQGDEKKILAAPAQCLISQRLNEKLGGDVVGKTFCYMSAPSHQMTIAGVFQDFDENSSFGSLDIVMSLPSIGIFSYDGTNQLIGNDRYRSYVRFCPDADMKKIEAEKDKMLKEMLPWEELKKTGVKDWSYTFHSVVGNRMQNTTVKTTCIVLSVVAFVMLFTAVMNYILVVISLLVSKARLVAIRKVLGAPKREFYLTTLKEAFVHLFVALLIMVLLLCAGQDFIRAIMGVGVSTLFSAQTFVVLVLVCLVVFVCCGLLPGYIYSHIPMVYAYRLFSESKRVWKLSLLAFQFVLSTMLVCVLCTIYRQYDYMLNKDMGYDYKNVAYIELAKSSDSTVTLAREIEKLPCVESTATAHSLFVQGASGNYVMLPGNSEYLFHYDCMYFAESGIVNTMRLKLVQGENLSKLDKFGYKQEVLVNEEFASQLKKCTGWDNVVGKSVSSTEFGNMQFVIKGVVKDFIVGSLVNKKENKPVMFFNGNVIGHVILLRFNVLSTENIQAVQQLCNKFYPDAELNVKSYAGEFISVYLETQHTRDLIVIGCIASLLITLVGLIGYVRDEVQRRSRELAIRKVMGATMSELQVLFMRSVAAIAVPSIIAGATFGWYLSTLMMEQFADKVQLVWYVFVGSALLVALIIAVVVFLLTRRVALGNPVEYIKNE